MNYTINQLNKDLDDMQAVEKDIRIDRGKRYGTLEDTLANVAEFGPDGVISGGFWECVMRIKKMYLQPKDLGDLENACHDLRNFVAYILILAKRNKQPKTICACEVSPRGVVPYEDLNDSPSGKEQNDE